MMLQPGDRAPEFSLTCTGGRTVDLTSLRGRKAVLYFYPKDDTSGCTQEAKEFSDLWREFEGAGVVVVGISPDSLASHDRFRAKYDLALTLASDEAREAVQAFGVWVEKSMYGRKYMGVERTTVLIGPDAAVARIWRNVKVPGHAAEVLAAAQAL